MPDAAYRSAARWILIVGALLALIPGVIPQVRTNGVLEFAHHWIWTAIIAAVALAPYAAVFILSSPARSDASRQMARGIAFATSLEAFTVLALSLLVALYVLLFGQTTLVRVQIASCILLIAMNAWMLWGALRGAGKKRSTGPGWRGGSFHLRVGCNPTRHPCRNRGGKRCSESATRPLRR